jgi:hypothetical protein
MSYNVACLFVCLFVRGISIVIYNGTYLTMYRHILTITMSNRAPMGYHYYQLATRRTEL